MDLTTEVYLSITELFQVANSHFSSQVRPIAMNNGAVRPGWFNLRELPPCRTDFDENGIVASISAIESIIQAKIHQGTDSRNIVLAGFSQGASLALMVALTTLHDLGGAASLSGWIPQHIREVGQTSKPGSKHIILTLIFE